MALAWDAERGRWRDGEGGRLLSAQQVRALRDALAAEYEGRLARLAEDLTAGRITLRTWARRFAGLLADHQAAGYLFGRGGLTAMAQADWVRLAEAVVFQDAFLRRFVADVLAGKLTDAEIAARSRLYAGAGVAAHAQGDEAVHDGLRLPGYPADGGTDCLGMCRCWWQIEEDEAAYRATWRTEGDDRVCGGCRGRGRDWSPFVQEKQAA